jgi:hypothetical protein
MAKFTFVVGCGISLHLEVEADSIEDAIDKAKEAPVMQLCGHCAEGFEGEWSTSGELDGTPGELIELWKDDKRLSAGSDELEEAMLAFLS